MALNKDGLERFAAVAASHVGEDKVPGLVALVAQGGDVHVEALGTLAVGGRPVERGRCSGSRRRRSRRAVGETVPRRRRLRPMRRVLARHRAGDGE
jgi:hypothetical protein